MNARRAPPRHVEGNLAVDKGVGLPGGSPRRLWAPNPDHPRPSLTKSDSRYSSRAGCRLYPRPPRPLERGEQGIEPRCWRPVVAALQDVGCWGPW